jgi:predicted nucleotidyltransferase
MVLTKRRSLSYVLLMDITRIKKLLKPLFKKKGAVKAFLFGSKAKGSDTAHSDIDIIIIDNENLPYLRRLDKYYDDIVTILLEPIDIFIYSEQEFLSMLQGPFVSHAMKESVILYE